MIKRFSMHEVLKMLPIWRAYGGSGISFTRFVIYHPIWEAINTPVYRTETKNIS